MPVYMIRAGEHGPVKIGYTDGEPIRRIYEFQTAHYENLHLLRVWVGGEPEERLLHVRFADLHIRGEWFSFSRLMLADVGLAEIAPIVEELADPVENIPPPVLIGSRIAIARKGVRLSQRDVARQIGTSPSAVAQWELNDSTPTPVHLRLLSQIFGVTVDWLLTSPSPTEAA